MERSGSAPAVDPSSCGSTPAGHRADVGVDTARCDDFKGWSDGKLQMFNPQRTPEQEAILASCNAALTSYPAA
jgi:hypothetical protein